MDDVPDLSEYRFTESHEWVHVEGGVATVGISDHAQSELGDVIFVELPAVGTVLKVGDKFGAIESVKAASDLYAPVGGTVTGVNDQLTDAPERVNADPYGEGWMIRLNSIDDSGAKLLDEAGYKEIGGS
jgi:glycine cleavage system H protein